MRTGGKQPNSWLLRLTCQRHRLNLCTSNLDLVRTVPRFLEKIITVDKTWVSVYEEQSKIESYQWIKKGTSWPLKALRARSTKKSMMTAFYDACKIMLVDFLPKNETMDSDYYIALLKKMKDRVRHQRPGMWTGGVDGNTDRDFVLLQDNAGPHTSNPTLAFMGQNRIDLIAHPQYSPDLSPCDFFLFPHLKKHLCGRRFGTLLELQLKIKAIFKKITPEMFEESFRDLAVWWKKCMASYGTYLEGCGVEVDAVSEASDPPTSSSESSDSEDND